MHGHAQKKPKIMSPLNPQKTKKPPRTKGMGLATGCHNPKKRKQPRAKGLGFSDRVSLKTQTLNPKPYALHPKP